MDLVFAREIGPNVQHQRVPIGNEQWFRVGRSALAPCGIVTRVRARDFLQSRSSYMYRKAKNLRIRLHVCGTLSSPFAFLVVSRLE
jgi:hypothetical protein